MAKKEDKKEEKKLSFHEQIHKELDQEKEHHYGYASGADAIKFPEKITTGSLAFDIVLEGGFRSGWSRFSGVPQMGKTAQGLAWAGHWQRQFKDDAFVAVFNAEGRVTPDLVLRSGINPDPRYFIRIDSNIGDYVVEKMQKWITHNPFGKRYFFIVDSSDALNRIHDLDKGADKAEKIGGGATLLSYTGKRLSLPVSVLGHHLYITSQLRDKMNAMAAGQGESGGNAPKFYSSLSGRVKKLWIKGAEDGNIYGPDESVIGHKTLIDLYKSPNEAKNEVILHIENGRIGGHWTEFEVLYILSAYGRIIKAGSWLKTSETFTEELVKAKVIDDELAIQGELNFVRHLENEKPLTNYLVDLIRSTLIAQ